MRTVVTRETEWTAEERGWMLALAVYRAELCARCGGDLTLTASPLSDPDNHDGTHIYQAKFPKRCHRCTALMASEDTYTGNKHVTHPRALIHHVERIPRPGGGSPNGRR